MLPQLLGPPQGLACHLDFLGECGGVGQSEKAKPRQTSSLSLGSPPPLPKWRKALGCLPSAKVGRNWTAVTDTTEWEDETRKGSLCSLSNRLLPPSILTCRCAVASFGFGFRLEGEALDEAAGEAASFLPGGGVGGDVGQVIM